MISIFSRSDRWSFLSSFWAKMERLLGSQERTPGGKDFQSPVLLPRALPTLVLDETCPNRGLNVDKLSVRFNAMPLPQP